MPLNEMSDSLKAKLYDIRYSPFLISFIISFIIYNYRFLMILFAGNIDLDIKFDRLDKEGVGIVGLLVPFGTAIFYTGIYPLFGNWLYEVTLKYKNDAKKRKVKAESLSIKTEKEYEILQREKNALVWDIGKMEKELTIFSELYKDKIKSFDKKVETEKNIIRTEYDKVKENLQNKINDLQRDLSNLEAQHDQLMQEESRMGESWIKVSEENSNLKDELNTLKQKRTNIASITKENLNLKAKVVKLESKINQPKVKKNNFNIDNVADTYQMKYTQDEITILNTIYSNDIKERTSRDILANTLQEYVDIARIKILSIVDELTIKDVIKTSSGLYYITVQGKKDMVNMFDTKN